ncbi:hypothetical protein ASPACDRAFT_46094 [Aspergillus aculeatus ATCC 16872]|uniref:Major facilitator superfamily (MFS) profile domain-containing protein n=1 Tax=Aspergillus aculeatus (strain ATCC 16872 / CBS 172.66 / WB 5094) TaxID=690307 RepID=A0A1L9WMB1_ASPA1|nr:uncharacterized protein ASPACDRAFT_46094 [Aspergillus aculeatus ATCC 16872]OJJ97240.1 hypothetical protein ASPACDRAFT_46094 [Aspergillus aculeatus ATCC 16872]
MSYLGTYWDKSMNFSRCKRASSLKKANYKQLCKSPSPFLRTFLLPLSQHHRAFSESKHLMAIIHSQSQLNPSIEDTLSKQATHSALRRVEERPHFQTHENIHSFPQNDDARNTAGSLSSGLDVEGAEHRVMQGTPTDLSSLANEMVFVFLCSMGLLLFGVFLGDVLVNQLIFPRLLRVTEGGTPLLVGSFLLANEVAVIIAGSVADLSDPKPPMTLAFNWLFIWNLVLVFSIHPARAVRAMQGVAVGVLQASPMSLGRLYAPGVRKNRIISLMTAMAPIGFLIGCLKGDFDALGALCAAAGCGLVVFDLNQGAPSGWQPYRYSTIIAGMLCFGLFYLAEQRAARPLTNTRLWTTPGFTPLTISYFLGYGVYIGGWMLYAAPAGSLLVTNQNLSAAIGTALADAVGQRVNHGAGLMPQDIARIAHLQPERKMDTRLAPSPLLQPRVMPE